MGVIDPDLMMCDVLYGRTLKTGSLLIIDHRKMNVFRPNMFFFFSHFFNLCKLKNWIYLFFVTVASIVAEK